MDKDWDWDKIVAPGPGVWKREREHRRAPRDHISEVRATRPALPPGPRCLSLSFLSLPHRHHPFAALTCGVAMTQYVGSPEHQASPVLAERFAGGDVRGWGYWTPPGIKPGMYRTAAGRGGGGIRAEAPDLPGLLWSQDGPPGPPLGIGPGSSLGDIQPFLDSLAKGQSIFERKPWREDLRVWELKIKPEAIGSSFFSAFSTPCVFREFSRVCSHFRSYFGQRCIARCRA